MHARMDAAGSMDAQTASTAPWKTAQDAVSHSAHTHHRFRSRKEQNEDRQPALHTKFLTLLAVMARVSPFAPTSVRTLVPVSVRDLAPTASASSHRPGAAT